MVWNKAASVELGATAVRSYDSLDSCGGGIVVVISGVSRVASRPGKVKRSSRIGEGERIGDSKPKRSAFSEVQPSGVLVAGAILGELGVQIHFRSLGTRSKQ